MNAPNLRSGRCTVSDAGHIQFWALYSRLITEEQRQEFGQLVSDTIEGIEQAQFLPHSGIRFPQNRCTSCPYIGLCLGRPDVVASALVRRAGAEHLDWINELAC